MTHAPFAGVYTALCTPMRGGGEIDEAALGALCEAQLRGGIAGLVACGTTGEAATMTPAEQARVIRVVVEAAGKRVPVLAGVGSPSTAHSLELARAAIAAGADGLLAVTPYYNRPSQEGLFQHFAALSRLGHPIMLYNVPARTGCDLLPETVVRLCELPQVVALKEASGSVLRTQQLVRQLGERLAMEQQVFDADQGAGADQSFDGLFDLRRDRRGGVGLGLVRRDGRGRPAPGGADRSGRVPARGRGAQHLEGRRGQRG